MTSSIPTQSIFTQHNKPKLIIKTLTAAILSSSLLLGCQSAPLATSSTTTPSTSHPSATAIDTLDNQLIDNKFTTISTEDNRHHYRLSNGLEVVIKEDHRAPVVMSQIWYRVGATDEPEDKGGISHLLEHMMFKGTDTVSGDDFDRLISKFGGSHNAFTSYDYTGYYEMLPVNRLGLALELEADRMTNLTFNESEFVKEHQVVMEERRQRTDDNPLARAYEQFRLLALPDSPKGESVIGPMAEIESITLAELKDWYNIWYAPDNATLVIVGDVQPAEVMDKVVRYFGAIDKTISMPRPSVRQQGFRGYQRKVLAETVNVPVLMMAYNVPTLHSIKANQGVKTAQTSEDTAYALGLLSDVLDGGLSARLETRLVREQGLLASVGTSYNLTDRGDSLFTLQASPREGVSLEQVEDALLSEIERLKTDPITDDEIKRAKTNTITALVYAQDSVAGQAQLIGSMQAIGLDDRLINKLPDKIQTISTEQMQNVAKKYLIKDNLTVMQIVPVDNESMDNAPVNNVSADK